MNSNTFTYVHCWKHNEKDNRQVRSIVSCTIVASYTNRGPLIFKVSMLLYTAL